MSEKQTIEAETPITPTSKSNTARTSLETVAEAEVQRENARHANPHGFSNINTGVDVKTAEEEFASLQRELSGLSHTSRRISRTQSRRKETGRKIEDVENVASSDSDEEPFDLETTLRGNHTVSDFQANGEKCCCGLHKAHDIVSPLIFAKFSFGSNMQLQNEY